MVMTKYVKVKINKTQGNTKGMFCGDEEMINYISKCKKIAQKE